MSAYPLLFTPLTVAHLTLPNRILMGSMHTGLEEHPDGAARLARFYAERAAGGAALIVTGGVAPNDTGRVLAGAATLSSRAALAGHRPVTDAVHGAGGRIALQILHAGRYAMQPDNVSPSGLTSPITPFASRALTDADIRQTIADFIRCACLAQEAGYDGVEVMGSEGYLINQFLAPATNRRDDAWGGDSTRRMRFAIEIVHGIRAAVGENFVIIYRLSMLDLIEGGSSPDEVVMLAQAIEAAGASILNTGIGWHEARIPTIATCVPRAAFSWVTGRLRGQVGIPLVATNRINMPATAEAILARGDADMVSMARPFLADARLVAKAAQGEADRINTCIACNQACLDHIFSGRLASCLVNPRACHEAEFEALAAPAWQPGAPVIAGPGNTATATGQPALATGPDPMPVTNRQTAPRRVAVVGAGPAGLACATEAAARGLKVTLFEAGASIGGQFLLACQVPGKEEFAETLRYFRGRLAETGVDVRLNTSARAADLLAGNFSAVVLATGVKPRHPEIPGIGHAMVCDYADLLTGRVQPGRRVAVIGAGGIGFDVAGFLSESSHPGERPASSPAVSPTPPALAAFLQEWGISTADTRGGLAPPQATVGQREIFLLQRKPGKPGAGLGKTTGWIHRTALRHRGVQTIGGVIYQRIDDAGLHTLVDGAPRLFAVDQIVVCAGQESEHRLAAPLAALGAHLHVIGGARLASEVDARRAIEEGIRVGLTLPA